MNRLEKLQAVKAWFNDHRSELQTQPAMVDALHKNRTMENYVRDIYFAIHNKPLSGCSSCLADGLLEVIFSEDRMKEIASILVYEYNHPDIQDSEPEKKKPRICRE